MYLCTILHNFICIYFFPLGYMQWSGLIDELVYSSFCCKKKKIQLAPRMSIISVWPAIFPPSTIFEPICSHFVLSDDATFFAGERAVVEDHPSDGHQRVLPVDVTVSKLSMQPPDAVVPIATCTESPIRTLSYLVRQWALCARCVHGQKAAVLKFKCANCRAHKSFRFCAIGASM